MIRIATVIDRGHPLYGQLCEVAPVSPDTSYLSLHPITVIGERWHTGYARDEQLAYNDETSEAKPDFLVVSPRDAKKLELVECQYCTGSHLKGTEQQCTHKPVEVRRMDEDATIATIALQRGLASVVRLQAKYETAYGKDVLLPCSALNLMPYIKSVEELLARLEELKRVGHENG